MNETVDVVIIGSGPAGSTFARVIKDEAPSARVLLVEGGPLIAEPPGRHAGTIVDPEGRRRARLASQGPVNSDQDDLSATTVAGGDRAGAPPSIPRRPGTWLLRDEPQQRGDEDMPGAAMSSNVGGMGAHWMCACPPPDTGERATVLPREDFDLALARARELLCVTQGVLTAAPLGDEIRKALAGPFDRGRPPDRWVQPMPLAIRAKADGKRVQNGAEVILGDLAVPGREGFELRPETIARRIEMDGGSCTGVELHDRSGNRSYRVRARAVVVACDALRTPQLLWASGIRPTALGHYLNDQPQVTGAILLDDRFARHASRTVQRSGEGGLDVLSGVSWIPYHDKTFPFHAQINQMDLSHMPIGVRTEERWPGSIVECELFAAKEIRFEDRVEFDDDESDSFGLPAIRIRYELTERDRKSIAEMVAWVDRIAGLLGTLVNGSRPFVCPDGSSLHYQGTVRMGAADTGTSVCDPGGRVWGTTNVYVGGNGVIPTPTACNPTLTNVAQCVHAARRLLTGLSN